MDAILKNADAVRFNVKFIGIVIDKTDIGEQNSEKRNKML